MLKGKGIDYDRVRQRLFLFRLGRRSLGVMTIPSNSPFLLFYQPSFKLAIIPNMGYFTRVRWVVRAPRDLEKMLRRLPKDVGSLFDVFLTDLENEGPFPKEWIVGHLSGEWKGYLKAKLKRDYRVIYRYESNIITIFIEKVGDRRDVYGR